MIISAALLGAAFSSNPEGTLVLLISPKLNFKAGNDFK